LPSLSFLLNVFQQLAKLSYSESSHKSHSFSF
jgi:hypothetical protein